VPTTIPQLAEWLFAEWHRYDSRSRLYEECGFQVVGSDKYAGDAITLMDLKLKYRQQGIAYLSSLTPH
jgi:hypothetical protein